MEGLKRRVTTLGPGNPRGLWAGSKWYCWATPDALPPDLTLPCGSAHSMALPPLTLMPCLLLVFPPLTLLSASQSLQLPQRVAFPSISPSSPSFHSPDSAVSNPGLLPACSHLPDPPAALSAPCVPMFLSVKWDENVFSLTMRNVSLIFHTSDLGQWGGGLLELTQDQ